MHGAWMNGVIPPTPTGCLAGSTLRSLSLSKGAEPVGLRQAQPPCEGQRPDSHSAKLPFAWTNFQFVLQKLSKHPAPYPQYTPFPEPVKGHALAGLHFCDGNLTTDFGHAWCVDERCHPEEQSDRRISQAHASQVRAADALVTCPVEKILFLSCIIINTFRPLFHRTAIPLARSWSKREPRVTH